MDTNQIKECRGCKEGIPLNHSGYHVVENAKGRELERFACPVQHGVAS